MTYRRPPRRCLLAALCSGSLLYGALAGGRSLAAPPPAPGGAASPAKAAQAAGQPQGKDAVDAEIASLVQELLNEGQAHEERGDLEQARASYLAAWKLEKSYRVAAWLGDVEARLGHHRDAAELLAIYARLAPAGDPGGAAYRERYAEVRARVGAVVVAAAGGAELRVDGRAVGVAPLLDPVFVEPGRHVIEARRGEQHARVEVELAAGQEKAVALPLGEAPPGEPARGAAPEGARPAPAPPGAPGASQDPWHRSVLIVGGGLAAAGLVLGVGMTVAANNKSGEIEGLRVGDGNPSACYRSTSGPCRALIGAVTELDTFTTVAGIGYVLAIGAAAGTAALLLLPPPGQRPASGVALRPAPWIGPGGGGAVVLGRF